MNNIITNIIKDYNVINYNDKSIIKYLINLIYINYFNILKNKINKLKTLKYKNLNEYKEIIVNYNILIKKYNNFVYNINYETYNIDTLKKDIDISLTTEIMPFKIAHNIYNNFLDSDKKTLIIKGLICFLIFKKTKTRTNVKLLIFNSNKSNYKFLDCFDILPLINFICPNLIIEINTLIEKDLLEDWKNTDKDINELYLGYLVTLSADKYDYDKNNILDILYFYKEYPEINIYLHIYYKIIQYKKNSNSYIINNFNQKHIHNLNLIKYNLEYNDSINNAGILMENNHIYISSKKFSIFEYPKNIKEYFELLINKKKITIINNKVSLPFNYNNKKIKYKFKLKDIIYSNFLNNLYKFNYNIIYILENFEPYILDIFLSQEDKYNNLLYTYIKKKYIVKKFNIISTNNMNIAVNLLLLIDNDTLDWGHFLENCTIFEENIVDDNLDSHNIDIFNWFKENFELYYKKFNIKAKNIIITFKHIELYKIFKKKYTDETDLNNFIIYYHTNYYISDYKVEEKNVNFIKNKNYDEFIILIKIFLYINKYY